MYKKVRANLRSSNSLLMSFPPDAPVGPNHKPFEGMTNNKGGAEEEIIVRRESDGKYSLLAATPSKAHGRDVYLSSRDLQGIIELRFERNADEIWTVAKEEFGDERIVAYNWHEVKQDYFAPTMFTIEVLEVLEA